MHTPFSARLLLRATAVAALWLTASAAVHAQLQADASRITQVKVYPGSATVERVTRVAAGARSVTFACLPAGLDVQSLQVSAGASVRVGETSVLSEARELSANCATSALDGRIRELEDQKAALQAETDALGMVTGYLKGLSGSEATPGARAPIDARNLTSMTEAMRRSGQDALLKQHQIQRRQTDLDRQLKPLLAERDRTQGQGAQVTAVTVTLAASADAEVKLSYQVNGPGWTPSYRALLDTTTRKVRIERQALVAQATGEDWRGVKLVLSTGQPRRETTGRLPNAWRIGIEPPPRVHAEEARMYAPMPAAAPIAADRKMAASRAREPLFDVSVFDNSFATEFSVPQSIDVPSNGQRVTLALGQHEDTAQLAARTSPRVDPSAFLVAEMAQPSGVWPAGPLQLYRDGNFVGQGRWNVSSDEKLTLSFGRDELVQVRAEPERDNQGTGGFAGSRAERQVQRAYVVENRHRTPIAVQVLEAAPVSVDEQVRVTTRFAPQPAEQAWNKQPGLAMWRFDLDAGQTARVSADYTIGYPKDARLQMR
ncbi:DUF4139 domain-containing protein [Acidovorax cavernicola]|uniref:Mucoidy inhibitor MuiA family protein n=1 Tax=Acidovorax cavernicola TaxID=1675792 RepID=A0A9X8GT21_9BURK|nr:DUF4139 domain-containing protein [Acidovorax cavernicola]RIX75175.1 mucoidy inhibitor MuiA family protein [Acidovorax cavernicola]